MRLNGKVAVVTGGAKDSAAKCASCLQKKARRLWLWI